MADEEELDPDTPDDPPKVIDPVRRAALKGPGGNTEKALGLEMARLFGMNPRLLTAPPSRPASQPAPQDEEAAEGVREAADDEQGDD